MKPCRRDILVLVAGAFAAPLTCFAQPQRKVWRIGFLSSRHEMGPIEEAFRLGLRGLGYIEGQNITIEWRFAKGVSEQLTEYATELARANVDCIVTNGTTASLAAKQASHTIPIVMGNSEADPARAGLVASLARPGGNLTGFTSISSSLAGKRLELLKATLPKISRVAILWDPGSRAGWELVRETRVAARALGLQLHTLELWDPGEIETVFRAASKERTQALLVVTAGLINAVQSQIISLATKARLPAMYANTIWMQFGALMGYSADLTDQYRRAAAYVDRVLKGAKPADLPVQQPTKFELVINRNAAKQIGLTIPQNVLASADKVIE